MDAKKLAQLCRELAENKKAEDVAVLDVRGLCSITDFFVIASGTSAPHLRAIMDALLDALRDSHALKPHAVDGNQQSAWVVLDYLDVIVHIMRPEIRAQYDLEGLWTDAPRVRRTIKGGTRSKKAADSTTAT